MSQVLPKSTGIGPSKGPRQLAQDVNLCQRNIYPCRCAANCKQLHLCRLFVTGMCLFTKRCKSGHNLRSSHNVAVLKERGLEQLPDGELIDAIKTGYLARNPITDLERRFALQICDKYLDDEDGCEDEDCLRLHVCDEYVDGTCANGSGCELSHQLKTGANADDIKRVGLHLLPHKNLLEVLRNPPTAKDVWQGQSARSLNLCRHNIHPSQCAGGCGQLHLCRLFIADMCPYDETCKNGHSLLSSSHNVGVLKELGLWQMSEEDLLEAIEDGYLARNPITDLERRFALQICRAYLYDEDGCEDEDCWRLHVCDDYVNGTCANGGGCEYSHQLNTSDNAANIRRVELNHLRHSELIQALRNRPTARDVWQGLSCSDHPVASSKTPSLPVQIDMGGDDCSESSQTTDEAWGIGSSEDLTQSAQGANLCQHNIYPAHCGGDCGQLHLCRLFVADMCPYGETCKSGHNLLGSYHNVSVLRDLGLGQMPEEDLLEAIEDGYLARNPITDLERRFALQICDAYLNDKYGCEDEGCLRLHVCDDYVNGTCGGGCELSHQLSTSASAAIIRRVELNHLRHSELIEALMNRPTAKTVWQDQLTQGVDLCRHNIHPSRCAGGCGQLHLCRLFLADMCPYDDETCRSGHNLHSSHNLSILEECGMQQLSEDDVLDAIEVGYLARHPITVLERRLALQICNAYLYDEDGCEDEDCWRLHVCDDYVNGTCTNGGGCEYSHQLNTSDNAANIRRVGLNNLRHSELIEALRAPPTPKAVWQHLDSKLRPFVGR